MFNFIHFFERVFFQNQKLITSIALIRRLCSFFKKRNKPIFICLLLFKISCVHYTHKYKEPLDYSPLTQSSSLNKIIRDISFFPINDERFRLSELKNKKAIVIFMRERDCPISEKYGPRIAWLERQYAKRGIQFIYNYVGQLKRNENAIYDLKRFDFKESYVVDSKQTIINALYAKTTGDVFILTPQRKVIYRGPLDDQYHLLKSALKPKNHYVSDILEALVSNKSVEPQEIPAPGCVIDRPVIKEVFWNDVAPIIKKKCTVCHNPSGSAPIDYISYQDVTRRKAMFKYTIENDLMPPWFIDPNTGPWENDLSLTPKEKAMLLKWLNTGCYKNPKAKKPGTLWSKEKKTAEFSTDYIIHLPEKVVVPPTGFNEYKFFVIQTNFKEDKWIKSVQFRLKPKVIHHAALFIMDLSFKHLYIQNHSHIGNNISMAFGTINQREKEIWGDQSNKTGYKLPRNAKFVLEIHYESIGRKIIDDYTQIHIDFHRKKPKYKGITYNITNTKFKIPPQALNHKVKTSYKTKRTMFLTKVRPHMHLRGKASSVFITDPKGIRTRIFSVDPFIKIFEKIHTLKNPILVKKGSVIECINWFDNSADNPINPNPKNTITFGLYTTDEMSQCYLHWQVPADSDAKYLWISDS